MRPAELLGVAGARGRAARCRRRPAPSTPSGLRATHGRDDRPRDGGPSSSTRSANASAVTGSAPRLVPGCGVVRGVLEQVGPAPRTARPLGRVERRRAPGRAARRPAARARSVPARGRGAAAARWRRSRGRRSAASLPRPRRRRPTDVRTSHAPAARRTPAGGEPVEVGAAARSVRPRCRRASCGSAPPRRRSRARRRRGGGPCAARRPWPPPTPLRRTRRRRRRAGASPPRAAARRARRGHRRGTRESVMLRRIGPRRGEGHWRRLWDRSPSRHACRRFPARPGRAAPCARPPRRS